MKRKKAIEQLKSLIDDRHSFIHRESDEDDEIYIQDIKALEKAIKALRRKQS